jgi:hypothetical protein
MNSVQLVVYYPRTRLNNRRPYPRYGGGQLMPMSIDRSDSAVLKHETTTNVKVRKYFPETWLWNSTIVGYRL